MLILLNNALRRLTSKDGMPSSVWDRICHGRSAVYSQKPKPLSRIRPGYKSTHSRFCFVQRLILMDSTAGQALCPLDRL